MQDKLSLLSVTQKQLIKYIIVGVIGAILDWGIYYLLTRLTGYFGLHLLVAKSISSIVVSIFSFSLNRFWSFRKKEKISFYEVIRFYTSGGVGIGINVLVTFVLVDAFHLYDLFSIVLATGITFVWTFTTNKFWVFKK